ncbi:hypothetical protein I6F15_07365 [Bradyrhizobium sp. BRP14]|nr:hypothetical protein [Bradyrhizobium sp. BRP14]
MATTSAKSTHPRKWVWTFIVFCAPLIIILFARWILNETIETQLIDYDFFAEAPSSLQLLEGKIPASVILALYRCGFSICATVVLAAFLAVYATYLIVRNSTVGRFPKVLYAVALVCVLGATMFNFQGLQRTAGHLPAEIARRLVDETLGKLPSCEDPAAACLDPERSIGNTASSVEDIVVPAYAIVALAGLSYISAVASITWNTEEPGTKKQLLENVTILAAVTFLLTVIAVHLLFRPGAEMISAAYGPRAPDAAPPAALQAYDQLSSAMSLYWATIFSLALCTSYFPASIYLNAAHGSQITFSGVWGFAKTALTVLAPIIATGAVEIADGLLNTAGR